MQRMFFTWDSSAEAYWLLQCCWEDAQMQSKVKMIIAAMAKMLPNFEKQS